MTSPDNYCRQKVLASGSSFYYSFLFLPPEKRRAMTALYAFCREVDDIADSVSEPQVAQAKLQWWQGEVAALFEGTPQHPITKALLPFVEPYALQKTDFDALIAGMWMDLQDRRYASWEELSLYCYRVAGVVGRLSTAIFRFSESTSLQFAEKLGLSLQCINIIRDLGEDARRGRCYLPQDECLTAGFTTDDLMHLRKPPAPEVLAQVLAIQAERARTLYEEALALLPPCDRYAQRAGLIMADIYLAVLAEMERDGFAVLDKRYSLTPIRKLWIAWQRRRKEHKLHKQWKKEEKR